MADVSWNMMNGSEESGNTSAGQDYTTISTSLRVRRLSTAKIIVIVKCAFLVLMAIFGTFGNILTLTAMRRTPRLRTKSNMLLAALSAAHLYMSLVQTPYFVTFNLWVYVLSDSPCYHLKGIAIMYPIPKIIAHTIYCHFIVIAADRYIAIIYPLHYETTMTVTVIKCLIGGSYAFGFTVAAVYFSYLQYINWNVCSIPYSTVMTAVIDSGVYIAVVLVTAFVYNRILIIALHHRSKIGHEMTSQIQTISDPTSDGNSDIVSRIETEKQKMKKKVTEFKAANMTVVLVCAYTLPLLPYEIGRIMQACGNMQSYSGTLIDVGGAIANLNTGFDWIIYGIMNRTFRRAFLRVLKIKTGDPNSE